MKIWQVALGAWLVLAAVGCRTDPNIMLLERELRLQEDEIFRLRGCLEDCRAELASARKDKAASQRGPAVSAPDVDLSLDRGLPDEVPEQGEAPGFAPPAPARPIDRKSVV